MTSSRVYFILFVTAVAVVVADQLTKQVALETWAHEPLYLIGESVALRVTYNSGGAFGLFPGASGFFFVATIVVMIAVVAWARTVSHAGALAALGLVLGGGAGNLVDRMFRSTPGVVDWIDVGAWPVFNLADASIVCGVGLLLLLPGHATSPSREASSETG